MVDIDLSVKELPSITTMDAETKVLTTDFWVLWIEMTQDLKCFWIKCQVSVGWSPKDLKCILVFLLTLAVEVNLILSPFLLSFMKPSVTDPRHWVLFDILSSVLSTKISLNQNNLPGRRLKRIKNKELTESQAHTRELDLSTVSSLSILQSAVHQLMNLIGLSSLV